MRQSMPTSRGVGFVARIARAVSHRGARLGKLLPVLFGGGVFGLVLLAFWLWAIFDVISTDESMVRNLPKVVWLLLVIFLSSIGAMAWLLLGRPEHAGFRPGDTTTRARPRSRGPEDEPAWVAEDARRARYAELDEELDRRLEEKRLQEWEDELRRREAELRHRDEN